MDVRSASFRNRTRSRRAISHLAPGKRVRMLLGDAAPLLEEGEDVSEYPLLFSQLSELQETGQWRETARWVKFEEVVEEGGLRWSKPHVAALSLHSVFELRSVLTSGTVILDCDATTLEGVVDQMLDKMVATQRLDATRSRQVRDKLLGARVHDKSGGQAFMRGNEEKDDDGKGNIGFMKKLPADAEGASVNVGEVNFLHHQHLTALIRLKESVVLGDLLEINIPTRFVFVMLGPPTHSEDQYKQIGRSIATLLTDEIFHDVAYKANNTKDLLDGIDEFLDEVTVLPPGEWDPSIRIEPPSTVPSQDKRRLEKEMRNILDAPEEGHADDPALKRTGRFFGGLVRDVKRKLPFYLSDYKDGLNVQCLATFFFMYFALLAPIVTFGGLLEEATGKNMAAMENLFAGAICGISYHLFAGQPLTIIGSTGPVLVFETIIFDACASLGINYLSFRFWVNTWTAVILFVMVVTDASALVSYITRFTEESFATLIALIFIYEAIAKLFKIIKLEHHILAYPEAQNACCAATPITTSLISDAANGNATEDIFNGTCVLDYGHLPTNLCEGIFGDGCYVMYDKFLMSLVLMAGTFILAYGLKGMKNGNYFPSKVRQLLSDFAVMIAIIVMVGIDILVGINTPKLNVPASFRPTSDDRGWLISPFSANALGETNPWWTALLAGVPALLACILIFMDQQITAVIVNRKENKLKKGCGYHLDLFVLAILIFITGLLGIPIYVAATVLSINHVNSLKVESESQAPGEKPTFVGIREQRVTGIVTFLAIGLSVLLTAVLKFIPMPVLYGVFLYMGIAALGGIQLFDRILLIFMPMKYQPDYIFLRHVPIRRCHLFTAFQVGCLVVLWVIKSTKSISIAFPLMLVVMVGVRKLMEKIFTKEELKHLDDEMPDIFLRKREDAKTFLEHADLHPVESDSHIHVPIASTGNVISIPVPQPKKSMNITEEMNKSGLWKHIDHGKQGKLRQGVVDDPIAIKIPEVEPLMEEE